MQKKSVQNVTSPYTKISNILISRAVYAHVVELRELYDYISIYILFYHETILGTSVSNSSFDLEF